MVEIGTQVNVIPLNTNLSCYNPVDKATSIMSKNIEPGIINYVPLYQIQAKFTKLSRRDNPKESNSRFELLTLNDQCAILK